jgi:hypothetical protein
MDRQPCGPPGRASKADLAAAARLWVDATCAQQGLAVKIADPMVLATVCALLERAQGDETALVGKLAVKPARRASRGTGRSD